MSFLRNIILSIFIISSLAFHYLILLLKYEDILMSFALKQIEDTRNVYDYIIGNYELTNYTIPLKQYF